MAVLTLRDYQEECVRAHYDFFAQNQTGHPLFVVPTGGGKSLIIAEFIKRSLKAWPDTRVLVLTHVKELIQQNHDEFLSHWGNGIFHPAGIHSAGIGRRDTKSKVLFAGIQSVWNKAAKLGWFDLILIDEAHLIPKKGQGRYLSFIKDMESINQNIKICGYTATHYRLDGGYLHKGAGRIFTDVAYEVRLETLIEEGFLVPLVSKRPKNIIDTTNVATSSTGDFNSHDLEDAAMKEGCVEAAVQETVEIARKYDRKSWLFFATGISHAAEIVKELEQHGVQAVSIFGHTAKDERKRIVNEFRQGKVPALVNVGVLTTGFNAPRCDLMAVMRPTQSASLYVQMMGRGMRIFPGKKDCLVMDYGENVQRHGPINRVKPKTKSDEPGPPPMKFCPACQSIVMLGVRVCPDCGFEFPPAEREGDEHEKKASELDPIDMNPDQERILKVDSAFLRWHMKSGKPNSLRVDYMCGMKVISEWVCLEHEGFPLRKAARWWLEHASPPVPINVTEALNRGEEVRIPAQIEIIDEGKYQRVSRSFFGHNPALDPIRHVEIPGGMYSVQRPAIAEQDIPF